MYDFMKDVKEMLNRRLGFVGVLLLVVGVLFYSIAFANSADLEKLVGEWKRSDSSVFEPSTLTITQVTDSEVAFSLHAWSGGNSGRTAGVAKIEGRRAIFSGEDYEFIFEFFKDKIVVSESGRIPAGLNVGYRGEYIRSERMKPIVFSTLSESKFLTPEQDEILKGISGKYYENFQHTAQWRTESDNLDGWGARVYRFNVNGMLGYIESIVMVNEKGEMWAAVIDGDQVRYFTNTDMTHDLPRTIVKCGSDLKSEK